MTHLQAQWLTVAIAASVTLFVLSFDVWIISRFGLDASISRVLARFFRQWPTAAVAVIFWVGVLVGHVWLPAE